MSEQLEELRDLRSALRAADITIHHLREENKRLRGKPKVTKGFCCQDCAERAYGALWEHNSDIERENAKLRKVVAKLSEHCSCHKKEVDDALRELDEENI